MEACVDYLILLGAFCLENIMQLLQEALSYLNKGKSVIPIKPDKILSDKDFSKRLIEDLIGCRVVKYSAFFNIIRCRKIRDTEIVKTFLYIYIYIYK